MNSERNQLRAAVRSILVAWFAKGNPRWVRRPKGYCGGGACFTYEVGGAPGRFLEGIPRTGRTAGMGHVSYNEEYQGWTANYGCASYGGNDVGDKTSLFLFKTADKAKAAVERRMPAYLEDHFRGIAESAVETIDRECGYFRDLLLPRRKQAAIDELLRLRLIDGGGP